MKASPWLRCVRPNANADMRLICLPHAGGAASAYASWHRFMPDHVEVWAVQLPGRENRLREPARVTWAGLIDELASAVASFADVPLVCFGHSMGALVAFELARHMHQEGRPACQALLLSGHRAAHLPSTGEPIHHLPNDAFIKRVTEFEGLPPALTASADFCEVWLPSLRADFTLCDSYRYGDSGPLECPIIAMGGVQDKHVSPQDLREWATHTRGAFRLHLLPGGHFYLHERRERFMQTLSMELAQLAGAPVLAGHRL